MHLILLGELRAENELYKPTYMIQMQHISDTDIFSSQSHLVATTNLSK
jgi:hypothetical protein